MKKKTLTTNILTRQRFFEFFVNFAFGALFAFSIFFTIYVFFALLAHGVIVAAISTVFAFFIGSVPLLFLENYLTLLEIKNDSKKQIELMNELLLTLKNQNADKNDKTIPLSDN